MASRNSAQIIKSRKADALALAQLLYDIYKEKKRKENAKVIDGQNNAQLNSSK